MKYVIDLEKKTVDGTNVWKAVGFRTLIFDADGIRRLEPYDELMGRDEAYMRGCDDQYQKDCKTIETLIADRDEAYSKGQDIETAYQQGMEKAWDIAKKICTEYSDALIDEMFGENFSAHFVMEKYSPSEVMAKIVEYNNAHTFRVGDVVIDNYGEKAVVIRVYDDDEYNIIYDTGECYEYITGDCLVKTGENLPEVEAILNVLNIKPVEGKADE